MRSLTLRIGGVLLASLLSGGICHAATVSFNLSATNNTAAPLTLAFGFGTPPLSLSGLMDVTDTISITITDNNRDGATMTGSPIMSGLGQSSATNLGVDIGNSCTVTAGTGSAVCTFSGSNTTLWQSGDNVLDARVVFTLSAHDSIAITGDLTAVPHVESVPEPASLTLLGLGTVGLGFISRKKA
jgi:hypothetical protein